MMWPYSTSSSRVLGIPVAPKIHINLADFAKSDTTLDTTLSDDIWKMIEWLSASTDTTSTDVIRGLLFQALYGRVAYEQLLRHVDKLCVEDDGLNVADEADIRKSVDRATQADLRFVGKANVNRKIKVPQRMFYDLDRQAVKANITLTSYVRGLLFKTLQGEVNYSQWQNARAELENRVKPPSSK